jgi:hypothetical protein
MKNQKLIKRIEFSGAIFGIIVGTLLHFIYAWSNFSILIAPFADVNESVWEHTKLFVFPVLIFMVLELYYIKNTKRVLLAKVVEVLFGITFIIAFFYTYTGIFGIDSVWIDIVYFMVAVAVGKVISYKILISKNKYEGIKLLHVLVLLLITIFYGIATFLPPHIPLFKDTEKNSYGPQK